MKVGISFNQNHKSYVTKPTNGGSVRNSIDASANFELSYIFKMLTNGEAIRPAILSGTKSETFVSQQLFLVDVDNGIKKDGMFVPLSREDVMDVDKAVSIAKEVGLLPCAIYYTSSHDIYVGKDELGEYSIPKFRIGFCFDEVITNFADRNKIQKYLVSRLYKDPDQSKVDAASLFYGTVWKELPYKDFDAICDTKHILELIENVVSDSDAKHNSKSKQEFKCNNAPHIEEALNYLNVSECSYSEWLKIGTALKNEGYSVEKWNKWSENDSRHKDNDCFMRWNGLNGNWNGGTIVNIAKLHGWNKHNNSIDIKEQLHFWDKDHKQPTGVNDYAVFSYLKSKYYFFLLKGKLYIYKNGHYVADETGTKTKTLIRKQIYERFIRSTTIERIYKLFLSDAEMEMDIDDVNQYPKTWINFKNGMLDVMTDELKPHSPDYYSINQIPHNYVPGLDYSKSVFKQFLESRITNEDDRKMLYEFMGSCFLSSIMFQKFMMLTGLGNAGKSVILNQTKRLVGLENVSAVPLQNLNEKFTTVSLLHKMVNICGDLASTPIKDSSDIKKLTGEDLIKGEYKGGAIIFFYNYAKFFFSCNELPNVLDERSNGFYRRLLIIRFDTVGEFINNLHDKLADEKEIEMEICFLISSLKNALNRGSLYESGANIREVYQLRKDSDSVEAFIDSECEVNPEAKILRGNIYAFYQDYCKSEERSPLGKTAFFKALRNKGYADRKYNGTFYFFGIGIEFFKNEDVSVPF